MEKDKDKDKNNGNNNPTPAPTPRTTATPNMKSNKGINEISENSEISEKKANNENLFFTNATLFRKYIHAGELIQKLLIKKINNIESKNAVQEYINKNVKIKNEDLNIENLKELLSNSSQSGEFVEKINQLLELNGRLEKELTKYLENEKRTAREREIVKLEYLEAKKQDAKERKRKKKVSRDFIVEISNRQKKNWNIKNTETIVNWIIYSNLYILLLDTYSQHLRSVARFNTLWSLLVSSITSTFSITQVSLTDSSMYASAIKWLILGSSLITSLLTGYIKIEKIQETIDIIERNRAKWLNFMLIFTEQINESASLRQDAEDLIVKHRTTFQKLFSKRLDIPKFIKTNVSEFLTEGYYLSKAQMLLDDDNNKKKIKKRNKFQVRSMLMNKSLYNGLADKSNMEYDRTEALYDNARAVKQIRYSGICCFSGCCNCKKSKCFELANLKKQVINDTKRQIEMYYNINTMVKNELLLLAQCFGEKIDKLVFDKDTYLLKYKIIRKDVNFSIDKAGGNFYCYNVNSPIQSDDEDDEIHHTIPTLVLDTNNKNLKIHDNLNLTSENLDNKINENKKFFEQTSYNKIKIDHETDSPSDEHVTITIGDEV